MTCKTDIPVRNMFKTTKTNGIRHNFPKHFWWNLGVGLRGCIIAAWKYNPQASTNEATLLLLLHCLHWLCWLYRCDSCGLVAWRKVQAIPWFRQRRWLERTTLGWLGHFHVVLKCHQSPELLQNSLDSVIALPSSQHWYLSIIHLN